MTMKFRQRIAWVTIVVYLSITCALTYYVFEINEKYTKYAFDHSSKFHLDPKLGRKVGIAKNTIMETNSSETSVLHRMFSHLSDIPLLIWIILFMIPYFQVFFLLLACTKPDPRLSLALLWPNILYLKWKQHCTATIFRKPSINGDCNSNVSNNQVIFDT
ncbi:lysosomal enzyme trafficking factor [Octopus bimaculoides]|uniref:Lysosomal enzyme trafficking factor n=1 Tax=Octopus bimaculoides TaxID=37653 RepID=A0A0L8GDV4_OCTBM|nr:lysosomal enzyme trafficking factor [Octopus bimaculoides]|eukprot:XP_014781863.1 PREDICTED: transmembrane protein 251-A-like [Octopus bimaculoides]